VTDGTIQTFRIEVALELIGYGSDGNEGYSETLDKISEHRLSVLDALLAHPTIDITARDLLGMTPVGLRN
jgi:hypothetical protein